MPTRTAAADRRVPRRLSFARWFFPKREITRVFCFVLVSVDAITRAGDVAREVDLREFAVLRKRSDAVVDRIVRTIRVVRREQFLDQRDHLGNVARRAWDDVGAFAA